jgi:adenylate cyclase
MKIRFRVTIMTILLSVLIATVFALGGSSYYNAHFNANELSKQIHDQTSARVEERLASLVSTAEEESDLISSVLTSGRLFPDRFPTSRDFGAITSFFLEVMKVHRDLSFLSLGLEATGEYCHVMRRADGSLLQQECVRTSQGTMTRSDFEVFEGARKRVLYKADWGYDPRCRPYYQAAKRAGRQTWTDSYVFTNDPDPSVPGVTYSTPIYDGDGVLQGVLSTDFNLEALCQFIKGLSIGREGFAFIIERDNSGVYKVIAHPNPNILISHAGREHSLFTVEKLADPRVGAFMKAIEPGQVGEPETDFVHLCCLDDGTRYVGGYRPLLAGTHPPHWLICTIVPEVEIMGRVHRNNYITLGVALSSFLLMILISSWVSRQVARPLEQLDEETKAIRNFQLDPHAVAHSFVLEVDRLATNVEEMKTGLRSFRKFVPVDLVRSMLSTGQEAALGGERRTLTIYFSDIADFTTISEQLFPEMLVEVLGEFLSVQSGEILRHVGTIDKFIGDSIMAFWGAPLPNAHHALAACTAAIRNQQKMRDLHEKWRAERKPLFVNRIGINTGEVIVGNIGYEERMNYTVIGDSVNLASRLEGLNKTYGTQTIIAEATYLLVKPAVAARPLDRVLVKGKTEPILIYELLGLKSEVDHTTLEMADVFSRALEHYWRQDWVRATTLFRSVLRAHAEDHAARLMLDRSIVYQRQPPGRDWNGVHSLTSK